MVNLFRGRTHPQIHIFPRSKGTLFQKYISRVPTPLVFYQGFLDTYEESMRNNLPKMAKGPTTNETTSIKEIENRIYLDLWNKSIRDASTRGIRNFEIVRKITIGFLKKEGTNVYKLYKDLRESPNFQNPIDELQLKITVDSKDTKVLTNIRGVAFGYAFSSVHSRANSAYIPINRMLPECLVECSLHVLYSEKDITQEGEIEISAQLIHRRNGRDREIGNKSQLKMLLYRCPQVGEGNDPFMSLKDGSIDKDIFVMPRYFQEEKHETYIKRLQLYSNQVLARHKRLTETFNFIREDGRYYRSVKFKLWNVDRYFSAN